MMKILFAAPDRDLLECYKQLLEKDLGEIVTAFDGTQVLALLSTENFDAAILDCSLPRVDHKKLVAKMQEKKIPIVALINETVSVRHLTEEPLPNAYLPYPFDAKKLCEVINGALEKASSDEKICVGDVEVIVSEFRIKNGSKLTDKEIDALRAISSCQPLTTADGVCIGALNVKFERSDYKTRIRYGIKKGFEAVTEDE